MKVHPEAFFTAFLKTDIGYLSIKSDHAAIREISFIRDAEKPDPVFLSQQSHKAFPPPLTACLTQLREYFKGQRKAFDLPLELRGTTFQKKVWKHLLEVPYGETRSYQELAKASGRPAAFRAVGGANQRNPIPIIIPCHRIIGSDGSLTGYGGGLWRKQWLLDHEQKHIGIHGSGFSKKN